MNIIVDAGGAADIWHSKTTKRKSGQWIETKETTVFVFPKTPARKPEDQLFYANLQQMVSNQNVLITDSSIVNAVINLDMNFLKLKESDCEPYVTALNEKPNCNKGGIEENVITKEVQIDTKARENESKKKDLEKLENEKREKAKFENEKKERERLAKLEIEKKEKEKSEEESRANRSSKRKHNLEKVSSPVRLSIDIEETDLQKPQATKRINQLMDEQEKIEDNPRKRFKKQVVKSAEMIIDAEKTKCDNCITTEFQQQLTKTIQEEDNEKEKGEELFYFQDILKTGKAGGRAAGKSKSL
jgi:hypothetical protein